MSLGKRVSFIILATLTMLLGTMLFFVDQYIVKEFTSYEKSNLAFHVDRVNQAFENTKNQMIAKVVDWAQWDNTYEFVAAGDDQAYVTENLNFLTLSALNFRHLVYFDLNRTPVQAKEIFYREESVREVPAETLERLKLIQLATETTSQPTSGLQVLNDSLVLYASSPILDSKREKQSRGALLGTMLVNQEMIKLIAAQTNLQLTATRIGIDPLGEIEEAAIKESSRGQFFVHEFSDKILSGYGVIKDSQNRPTLLYRIDVPRTSYKQALTIRSYLWASLVTAGLLWSALTLFLLHLWILKPISSLSKEVRRIKESEDPGTQVRVWNKGNSLKLRAAAIIGSTLILLNGALGYLISEELETEFSRIEVSEIVSNMQRASKALNERLDNILSKAIDWGQWDDTYSFIVDQNEEYSQANMIFETLGAIGMSHALFFDTGNNLVTGRAVDFNTEQVNKVEATNLELVAPFQRFVLSTREATSGLVAVHNHIFMVAKSPILDTTRTMESRGTFLFAMPLDEQLSKELAAQTKLSLSFGLLNDQKSNFIDLDKQIEADLSDAHQLRARKELLDAEGKKVIYLQMSEPRRVFQQGQNAKRILYIWLTLASIAFIAVTLFAIQKWIIRQVVALKKSVLKLDLNDESIHGSDRDELATLSNDINGMLQALNKTQRELVEAKNIAEAANRAKSTFIARVSHELRTPVGGIIGLNRIILKREHSRATKELLGMSNLAAEGLLSIINEILDYTKAESGNLSFEKIPFDLQSVIRDSIHIVAGRLEGSANTEERPKVELVAEIDSNSPTLLVGDPTKLKQIIINLLGNAAKFTEKGYVGLRVTSSILPEGKCSLEISVWDTGIGIPKEKLERVFEPFKQADESIARKFQGTGLGLSIVKQFTTGMGGTVGVDSEEGKGSTFKISIPFEINQDAETQRRNLTSSRLPSSTVFIGDEDIAGDIVLRGLESLGVNPITVINPAKGGGSYTSALNSELLVITERGLLAAGTKELIDQKLRDGTGVIVALVRPSNLSLKEELYSKGVSHILSTPALAQDIVGVYRDSMKMSPRVDSPDVPSLNFDRKLNILIADDVPTNILILEDMLKDAGHNVVSVNDGKYLVERLKPMLTGEPDCEKFDIVLTDVSMPIMDGISATFEVRRLEAQNPEHIHIPIIAITAHGFTDEHKKLMEVGVDSIAVKPIDPKAMAESIQKALGSR